MNNDSTFCNCPCHSNFAIAHCMPCCEGVCPKCRQRVKKNLREHIEKCIGDSFKDFESEFNK